MLDLPGDRLSASRLLLRELPAPSLFFVYYVALLQHTIALLADVVTRIPELSGRLLCKQTSEMAIFRKSLRLTARAENALRPEISAGGPYTER